MMENSSRSLEIFQTACKSYATKKCYTYWLDRYMKHTGAKTYDELLLGNPEDVQVKLEDYLLELKQKNFKRSAIDGIFSSLELFYLMNHVKTLNFKLIRKLFPEQEKIDKVPYTTEHIKQMLELSEDLQTSALVHFLAASGARIGAIDTLKIENLTAFKDTKSILVYAETKDEYTTFLTPEASQVLDSYLENRKTGRVFGFTYPNARMILYKLRKKADIEGDKIPIAHGFRMRWDTIFKNMNGINTNLIEKMMGHSVKLDDSYHKPTIERLFQEYEKGIPELTIFRVDEIRNE